MVRVFRSPGDIEGSIDDVMGPTSWHRIGQATIDAFAAVTGDHQWIHVDRPRATASGFGRTIAHGYLTLSLIPAFSVELFRFELGEARLNYGLDRVRFPAPVPADSWVRASATLTSSERTNAGWQVRVRWTVESDQSARPACVADTVTLVTGLGPTSPKWRDLRERV